MQATNNSNAIRQRFMEFSRSGSVPSACGELHRLDDFRVGRAAAQVARQVVLDVVLARVGVLVQQLARHQHEARRAEAALECGRVDECLLHGVELAVRLDGRHFRAFEQRGEVQATRNRAPVHQHGAAAAQPLRAALASAVQAERLPQHFDQAFVRRDLRAHRLAVQTEADLSSHFCIAWNTASALSGSEVMRTPTASCTALAIAGDTPKVPVSPTPFAPNGPLLCSATTASLLMLAGRSRKPGILYSASEALRSWPAASNCIFSSSVKPSCMIAPPESCVSTMRGLIGVPTSATFTMRATRTRPVSVSTSTSTPVAPTIQNGVALSVRPFASGDLYAGM